VIADAVLAEVRCRHCARLEVIADTMLAEVRCGAGIVAGVPPRQAHCAPRHEVIMNLVITVQSCLAKVWFPIA
jgi:hypothetical protein